MPLDRGGASGGYKASAAAGRVRAKSKRPAVKRTSRYTPKYTPKKSVAPVYKGPQQPAAAPGVYLDPRKKSSVSKPKPRAGPGVTTFPTFEAEPSGYNKTIQDILNFIPNALASTYFGKNDWNPVDLTSSTGTFDPAKPWETYQGGIPEKDYRTVQSVNQNLGIVPTNEDLMRQYWDMKQSAWNKGGAGSTGGLTYDLGDPEGPPKPPGYDKPGTTIGGEGGYNYPTYSGAGYNYPTYDGGYSYPSYGPSNAQSFQPRDNRRGWVQKVLNWRISE